MKERPILFSAPMVRAILAGTKTQTRRIVKPRLDRDLGRDLGCELAPREIAGEVNGGDYSNAYCAPGDRLWVREAWRILGESPDDTLDMFDRDDVQYRADEDQSYIDKYRPSIHMPRRFSRITLEVTGVRVERLQDISEEDAKAEGAAHRIAPGGDLSAVFDALPGEEAAPIGYQAHFRDLWESINGAESWAADPWVWVVSFRRVTP